MGTLKWLLGAVVSCALHGVQGGGGEEGGSLARYHSSPCS